MLLVKLSSTCDVCLEPYQLKGESSPTGTVRVPCAIDCGHIFCSLCIDSLTRLACPLCRSYYDPRAVRRLHIDVAPQTPDVRSARVGRPDRHGATTSKEDLKDRIISIVRNGADGSHYQALIHETCAWLKEQTPEEHWDLRALYLLLTRYHQMHKDEQAATVNLHEKTKLYQDALRRAEKRQQEIAELKQTIEDLKDEMHSNEFQWAVREKQLSMKYEAAIEETRSLREQLITLCAPRGRSDRHRSSEARVTSQRVFEPMVEDECSGDTLAPMKPIIDHFSPLPVHLSPMPMPSTINAVSPIVENIADCGEEEDYFKPHSQSSEDGDTPVEYPPPLVATPASKPMVIGAAIARFYDMAASETSASLPHPTPAAYYNRRHEKEKEKLRELSRNNSSGSTGRVPLSRIRALQEKLVPESGDEAERTRTNRRQLLNAILADAPTPQPTPAPIHAGPPPPTPPPPPPLPQRRPTGISRASTAAEEIERERERRRRQSSENRGPESPAVATVAPPPPPPPPQVHGQRLAHPRPSALSLKDTTNTHGPEDGMQRRPVYSERRSATERRPSIGKPFPPVDSHGTRSVKPL